MPVAAKAELTRSEWQAAVEDGTFEAYKAEGFTVSDGAGGENASTDALAKALYAIIKPTLARSDKEKSQKAIGKKALTALVFPTTPGPSSPQWDPDDEVAPQVWKNLDATVGRLIGSSRRTKVQQLFTADGLVLCQAKVGLDQIESVYVTDNKDLILADFFKPRSAALVRKGEEVASDLDMVADRIPAMRKVLTSKLDNTLKKTQIAARAKLALTTGDTEDE